MNYKLINNHYIIEVEGKNYLLDTGSPDSFWTMEPIKEVVLDDQKCALKNPPSFFNPYETNKLVGVKVDGFIGMDFVSKTGLTIYQNGEMKFSLDDIEGRVMPMSKNWPLVTSIGSNMMNGQFVIDTGAMYGYGVSGLFYGKTPYNHVYDYNPGLGHLDSDIYHLDVVIGGQRKVIDVCNNERVALTLKRMGAIMIASVSSLFEEACVLDTKKGRLILK